MASDHVVITGVGMRTPLGPHAAQSAASIRARINRFRAWPHIGQELGEPGGVIASYVSPDLGDVSWSEKVVPLLRPAAQEAIWSSRLWDLRDRPDGVQGFVAAPPLERAASTEQERAEVTEALAEDWLGDEVEIPTSVVCQDRAGGAIAVARAIDALRTGKAEVCVVGGVDSFLQSTWLSELFEAGRLKAGERPAGLVPGEAGAALVLEEERSARRRKAPVLARIDAVALEKDAAFRPEAAIRAEGLTRALRSVLQAVPVGEVRRVISDLNGERWRHQEWATAEARCLDGLRDWRLWHPADSVGDVGAAYVPLACAFAVRALARGGAGGGKIVICASSDSGERAALGLSGPLNEGRPST